MDLISIEAAIEAIQDNVEPFVMVEPGTTCLLGAGVKETDVIRELYKVPVIVHDFITCADCRHAGKQIADGRYWCNYHDGYMRYCSDAERRQG